MSTCTEKDCRIPAQSAGLCLRHWYRKKERERAAWRTDPTRCYQCGRLRDDHRKACTSCRAKENRRRKKQRDEQRTTEDAVDRAQRRRSDMQRLRDAKRTLKDLLSFKPAVAPHKQAPAPDFADLLSSPADALDPPQPEQDPPQDSGPRAWERHPDESAQAYRAFVVYLHLGLDRSLQKAYRRFKESDTARLPGRWRTWCRQHEWVARAADYDRRQYRLIQQDAMQTEKKAFAEHRRAANQAYAESRAAIAGAARRAYARNRRRWRDEGRICRSLTRAGAPCQRLAMPGEHYCPAHTRQALQDLAIGVVLHCPADQTVVDSKSFQIGARGVPMPQLDTVTGNRLPATDH